MIIKVFQTNKNGKIELDKEDLETILNEVYWEGYNNARSTWTYTTPKWPNYTITTTTLENNSTSLSNENIQVIKNEI